jgi:hypothetical protein
MCCGLYSMTILTWRGALSVGRQNSPNSRQRSFRVAPWGMAILHTFNSMLEFNFPRSHHGHSRRFVRFVRFVDSRQRRPKPLRNWSESKKKERRKSWQSSLRRLNITSGLAHLRRGTTSVVESVHTPRFAGDARRCLSVRQMGARDPLSTEIACGFK